MKFSRLSRIAGFYIFPEFIFISGLIILCSVISCKSKYDPLHNHGNDLDTLKVVTLYGPTSFFNYRGDIMGIDYENVRKFADEEGMVLMIEAVNNITELIDRLKSGEAHLAAYPVPSISEYNDEVIHCGPKEISRQVLLQKNGSHKLSDVTELIGKNIYVEKNSKFHYRLENLNNELGGGINIITLESDTINSEDFFNMVHNGEVEYAVVDSDIASLYKPSYPDLDMSLGLSADQSSSWAVALGLDSLALKINRWENKTHSSEFVKEIYKRYYDGTLSNDFNSNLSYFKTNNILKNNKVSDFDEYFKKYAYLSGYEWTVLAAIAYCESRFNPNVTSRFGASGLMQVMPSSAKAVGIAPSSIVSPDYNIKAAALILSRLNKNFEKLIDNPEERMKFVIAAYNSGLGHIFDAMALAEKNGLDPHKWTGNVSITALMKSRPEVYNDPIVKHGYFRGRETVDFVDNVTSIYKYLKENIN